VISSEVVYLIIPWSSVVVLMFKNQLFDFMHSPESVSKVIFKDTLISDCKFNRKLNCFEFKIIKLNLQEQLYWHFETMEIKLRFKA